MGRNDADGNGLNRGPRLPASRRGQYQANSLLWKGWLSPRWRFEACSESSYRAGSYVARRKWAEAVEQPQQVSKLLIVVARKNLSQAHSDGSGRWGGCARLSIAAGAGRLDVYLGSRRVYISPTSLAHERKLSSESSGIHQTFIQLEWGKRWYLRSASYLLDK
jgi:hypothetical protein